jgi:hypothetical protein
MNLALKDPFELAQDYPDALTDDLSESQVLQSVFCSSVFLI